MSKFIFCVFEVQGSASTVIILIYKVKYLVENVTEIIQVYVFVCKVKFTSELWFVVEQQQKQKKRKNYVVCI